MQGVFQTETGLGGYELCEPVLISCDRTRSAEQDLRPVVAAKRRTKACGRRECSPYLTWLCLRYRPDERAGKGISDFNDAICVCWCSSHQHRLVDRLNGVHVSILNSKPASADACLRLVSLVDLSERRFD